MENIRKKRIRKPEGVFVLCLLTFLNFGVYQFYIDFSAMRQTENETPLLIAILLISFDVFSAASAIWAFFGDNYGRISLLIFVSLNMLWSIFVLIMTIAYATPKANGYYDGNIFFFAFSLLKPLFLFGLCWWYFTRKDVIAYYKQDNQYEFF
jgi:MFS family permease